jgi:4-aminobutyrate aminotransferase-like enzyme
LACAAGTAFLAELEKGELVDRSRILGEKLLDSLRRNLADIPEVAEVRGRGLFVGIDLRNSGGHDPLKGAAVRAATQALKEGILVLPAGRAGHVLELSPPLVISEEQLDWMVPRLKEGIQRALAE